ncbi:MAG: hypothetical protein ACI3W8_01440 [Oscillospiraceae bacterium]
MVSFAHKLKSALLSMLGEEDLLSHSHHQKLERFFLMLRNIAAGAAVLLFLLSFILPVSVHHLKAVAYFCGAAAYLFEIAILTDCFTTRVSPNEMFMAYCFGPMYVLLGISYLTGH